MHRIKNVTVSYSKTIPGGEFNIQLSAEVYPDDSHPMTVASTLYAQARAEVNKQINNESLVGSFYEKLREMRSSAQLKEMLTEICESTFLPPVEASCLACICSNLIMQNELREAKRHDEHSIFF